MVVVEKIFKSIIATTYNEQYWKQLLEQIHNSNKSSQEISIFLQRLFQRMKKHEETNGNLKTNQIKILLEYILKILSTEEVQIGKDWNNFIFDTFSILDKTIQNLIIEISLILVKVDDTYRSKILKNAISKPNQTTF